MQKVTFDHAKRHVSETGGFTTHNPFRYHQLPTQKIMTSIKIKFRPSNTANKEGTIYYQIIHNRICRQLRTDYKILTNEWDSKNASIISDSKSRKEYLLSIEEQINWDIKRILAIINHCKSYLTAYNANTIVSKFLRQGDMYSFSHFMKETITLLQQQGKQRTAENYQTSLNSFMLFRNNKPLLLDEINPEMMITYEAYLHRKGVSKNSSSFYMRTLRAVYNRAVEKELTMQRNPFKYVYTGVDKTIKRAISLNAIKQIKILDLSSNPHLDFARDMFLFSFYTRGMSFIDMAHLKKQDLSNGTLSYRRRKTKQLLFIHWEKCMQEIVEKYNHNSASPYLLPILKSSGKNRSQYKNALSRTNKLLKEIAQLSGISIPLTLYVARHSWASIAKNQNIPIAIISEGMGHSSETTTRIYLASLDNTKLDKANAKILKGLQGI